MIIFIYGKDSYRIKEQTDKLLDGYRSKNTSGVNVFKYDFSQSENNNLIREVEENIKTLAFFKEKKIILIYNIFSSKHSGKFTEINDRWQVDKSDDIISIVIDHLEETELKKKDKKLWEMLNKKAKIVQAMEPLSGPKLETWLKAEFKKYDSKIEPLALKKLINYFNNTKEVDENYSWQLIQEVQKLSNYCGDKEINSQDVELLVVPKTEEQIFPIIDSLAEKNQIKAFTLLYQGLAIGMDPSYILSMVIYQFRNLLSIKDLSKQAIAYPDMVKKSGLNPFVVRKTLEQSKKFELDELKKRFNRLAEIEISTKNGLTDVTDEIYSLVF